MKRWLFLINIGALCLFSCRGPAGNINKKDGFHIDSMKTNTATQEITEVIQPDSIKERSASDKDSPEANAFIPNQMDTFSREKKIIHKHKGPQQDQIDSLKKIKGKNKFKQK